MPNQGGTHEQHVKAGQQSHKNEDRNKSQQASGREKDEAGHRGGSGNFGENRDRASEAGRKGGQH